MWNKPAAALSKENLLRIQSAVSSYLWRRSRMANVLIHLIFFRAGPLNKFIQLVMNGF
jgi:hypothetical protein